MPSARGGVLVMVLGVSLGNWGCGSTEPSNAARAAYTIAVVVGSRPPSAAVGGSLLATGKANTTIQITETNGVAGELVRLVVTVNAGGAVVDTDTLDAATLRTLAPGGALAIPARGTLSIPFQPQFTFNASQAVTFAASGDFRDAGGNTVTSSSVAVPVAASSLLLCDPSATAPPPHVCVFGRFRVQAFFRVGGGIEQPATTAFLQAGTDNLARFFLSDMIASVTITDECGLAARRFRVQYSASTLPEVRIVIVDLGVGVIGLTQTYFKPADTAAETVEGSPPFTTCS